MRHIRWPSIEQFRTVVKNVQHRAAYIGMDSDGSAIIDKSRKSPTLRYEGTVKLHGTCSAVGISSGNEMWCQSRENIITPEKDNAGFAMFAHGTQDLFFNIAIDALEALAFVTDPFNKDVLIFGEWCGGNIQKTVAIAELPKMFVIFGIAIVDTEGQKTYLTRKQVEDIVHPHSDITKVSTDQITASGHQGIYSIYNFQTFEVEIDFENPHLIQNELNKLTEFVGDICPVAHSFGVDGIGEGIVWRCIEEGYSDSGFWFKVKDDRHSNSKVKTLATVDVERIDSIKDLCLQLANNGRLTQICQTTFNLLNGGNVDVKRTGEFIKNVMADVFKEDTDIIAASGFTGKEVSSPIAKICRDFLMHQL